MVSLEDHDWPDHPRYAPGRRRAHGDLPVHLVVVGDSFSYTDEHGDQLPGAPTVWPTVAGGLVAEALGVPVSVTVLARPAMTARQALEYVRKDRHAQHDVLATADAVVLAIGSYDHAPMGVPTPLRELAGHVRPYALRRRVRRWVHVTYRWVVRLTGSRLARTATGEFERDYARVLAHLRGIAHGAAGVAVGPSSHRSAYYGWKHPRHAERERLQLDLAAGQGFVPVASWPLVLPYADRLNADGIHWPGVAHQAVAAEVATALVAQLTGEADRPPRPGRDD